MATRRSANLSPAQIRAAIPLFQARIVELENLALQEIVTADDLFVRAAAFTIEAMVAQIYGPETHDYRRLREAWAFDATPANVGLGGRFRSGGNPAAGPSASAQQQAGIERGLQRAIALLRREIALMWEQLGEDGAGNPADQATEQSPAPSRSW